MRFQNEVEQLADEPRSVLRYGNKGVITVPGNISASFLEMKRVVMIRAPVVWRICMGMAKKKGNQDDWAKSAEIVTLSSVSSLLYSKNSQANAWQTTMRVFYYASGIQKIGLDALHELGACPSYTHLNHMLHEMADSERKLLKAEAHVKPYLIQLDNINRVSVFELNKFEKSY